MIADADFPLVFTGGEVIALLSSAEATAQLVKARARCAELEAENAKLRAAARAWLAAERHTRIINAGATPEARRAYREARQALKRLAETLAREEERK